MDNTHKYSLEGINIPSEAYLSALFEPEEVIHFRILSDKSGTDFYGKKERCKLEEFSAILERLIEHNRHNRGIFCVVNKGGDEDSQIDRINAHFMECDNLPLEEQLEKIRAFPLEPSLIVKTRKSLHCYWLMKDADVSRFRHIQKQLIAHFGADPACVNESRVLRVPGFYHCKEEPVLVECIKYNPELRYSQAQLEKYLPTIPLSESDPPKNGAALKRGTQKGLMIVGHKCEFIKYCKKNAKTLPEPLWYAMITNLSVLENGEAAVHSISKPYPDYSFEQTQRKIENFYKSGTRPMTCRTIAEKGFQCPKLDVCGRKCKSPAGLAFFPMDINEIAKRLSSVKIGNTVAENMITAQNFINDYLFNVNSGIATAVIADNIKSKFGFKTAQINELTTYFKDVNREFFASNKSSKARDGSELPPWYERNKNGTMRFMPGILADHLRDEFHAFHCTEQYYFYKNGVYYPRTDKDAKATVRTYLNPREVTLNHINDAEGQWQLLIRKEVREINPNKFTVNCVNGYYNVLDDSFKPHTPAYYSTVQVKANYDPAAVCPRFTEFLHSTLEQPEIDLLQEIYGYFLVPITRAQKSFLLCGKPNVGKSTILTVLQEVLLGAENVSNIPIQKLGDRFQPAELFGKLANIYADLSNKGIDDAGMFKAVTGEDYITGERKHKDPFSFKPHARFMYSCNDIPRNYGDRSEAFYRRLIIIRFSKAVPDHVKDLQLIDKLQDEADGILTWSIAGLKRLIKNNYQFTETDRTKAELMAYKVQNNNVLAFIVENCAIDANAVSLRSELYDLYREFCKEGSRGKPASESNFNNDICSFNPIITMEQEKTTRKMVFRGIKTI